MQLTPHIHLLVPEAVWSESGQMVPLPPPEPADVERVLRRILKQLARDLSDRELPEYAEDGLEALQQEGVQERLDFSYEELTARPLLLTA